MVSGWRAGKRDSDLESFVEFIAQPRCKADHVFIR
jgi:hypothetical protein